MQNPLYAGMTARPSVNGSGLVNACLVASLRCRLRHRGCRPSVLGQLSSHLRSETLIDTHVLSPEDRSPSSPGTLRGWSPLSLPSVTLPTAPGFSYSSVRPGN